MIATNIRRARIELHYTQEALAHKLNVSWKAIQNWEGARSIPQRSRRRQIAAVLGHPWEWFLTPHEYEEEAAA